MTRARVWQVLAKISRDICHGKPGRGAISHASRFYSGTFEDASRSSRTSRNLSCRASDNPASGATESNWYRITPAEKCRNLSLWRQSLLERRSNLSCGLWGIGWEVFCTLHFAARNHWEKWGRLERTKLFWKRKSHVLRRTASDHWSWPI